MPMMMDTRDQAPAVNLAFDCLLLLPSIHFILKAEQLCQQQNLDYDLVPTPRALSSACGMSLAFRCADLEALRLLLNKAALPSARLFYRDEKNKFHLFELC